MSQGDWHHRLASAETEEIALADIGTAWPTPDSRVVGVDISRRHLVRFRDTLASVCFLDGILIADAIAVWC